MVKIDPFDVEQVQPLCEPSRPSSNTLLIAPKWMDKYEITPGVLNIAEVQPYKISQDGLF
jgi:hypothetical protein